MGSRLVGMVAVVAAAVATLAPAATSAADVGMYAGLGTWLDIYDGAAWDDPEGAALLVSERGVRTLYVETSNSSRPYAIRQPVRLARLVEAAHAAGVTVVAWYLPTFTKPARDLRRSLAAIRFRTPSGQGFDSFALDIESSDVRSVARRNARVLELSAALRATVGPDFPLGAIIPSPRGMELRPGYWPGFPYAELAELYDVFLPMTYFTYRVKGGPATRAYVARSIAIIRAETGKPDVPIHVIGGIADRTSAAAARGFMRAVSICRPFGFSLYDFFITLESAWTAMATPPPPGMLPCA